MKFKTLQGQVLSLGYQKATQESCCHFGVVTRVETLIQFMYMYIKYGQSVRKDHFTLTIMQNVTTQHAVCTIIFQYINMLNRGIYFGLLILKDLLSLMVVQSVSISLSMEFYMLVLWLQVYTCISD